MIHVISSYHVMLIAWTSAARRCVQEHNPRILQASGRQNKTRRLHPETNSIRSRHLRGRDDIRMGIISVQAHQRRMRKDVNIRGFIQLSQMVLQKNIWRAELRHHRFKVVRLPSLTRGTFTTPSLRRMSKRPDATDFMSALIKRDQVAPGKWPAAPWYPVALLEVNFIERHITDKLFAQAA